MIMRKILIISITAFTAALFIGCSDSDYSYTSNYIYKNDSSRDITMKSYNYANGDLLEDANYTFVIPAGKAHTLRFVDKPDRCGLYCHFERRETIYKHPTLIHWRR